MSYFYLSGPMTGIPNFNHDQFNLAAFHLRSLNAEVWNPAEEDGEIVKPYEAATVLPDDLYDALLEKDIEAIESRDCDGVVVLPGWDGSPGATKEITAALNCGKAVLPISCFGLDLEQPSRLFKNIRTP